MTCSACSADQHPTNSAPRQCAFGDGGLFNGDNWACVTMLELRELVDDAANRERIGSSICQANESSVGVIPIPDWDRGEQGFVVLEWYKRRGTTHVATVVSDEGIALLTLGCAEALVEFYRDGVVP